MTTATNQHYELDPRIFEQFLGSTMKYSSGLFPDGPHDDLDRAQHVKLDFVADCLRLEPGHRLLDVGCGWGSLILHMAEHRGVNTVGITPSPVQATYVERAARARGIGHLVEVRLGELPADDIPRRSFEAITLLGSIVHMSDRVGVLRKVHDGLVRGGRVYLSESCYRSEALWARLSMTEGARFVREEVFGAGDMVPLSRLIRAMEDADLVVKELRDLTNDYEQTIRIWLANIARARDVIDAIEPGCADALDRYLRTGNAAWHLAARHHAIVAERR